MILVSTPFVPFDPSAAVRPVVRSQKRGSRPGRLRTLRNTLRAVGIAIDIGRGKFSPPCRCRSCRCPSPVRSSRNGCSPNARAVGSMVTPSTLAARSSLLPRPPSTADRSRRAGRARCSQLDAVLGQEFATVITPPVPEVRGCGRASAPLRGPRRSDPHSQPCAPAIASQPLPDLSSQMKTAAIRRGGKRTTARSWHKAFIKEKGAALASGAHGFQKLKLGAVQRSIAAITCVG